MNGLEQMAQNGGVWHDLVYCLCGPAGYVLKHFTLFALHDLYSFIQPLQAPIQYKLFIVGILK
jgi:hypothetical protein